MEHLAYARIHFGMKRAEFMRITPRYFDALVSKYERKREIDRRHSDLMLAQLTAMVANTGMVRWDEWRQPKEFLPAYRFELEDRTRRARKMTFDEQIDRAMDRMTLYQQGQVSKGIE